MRRETEFVRPELAFERDFLQVRNWWVRDKRIVGNASSIFFYLLSHRSDFRVTQSKVMRDLGLGKDAYLAARRKLEAAGYLEVVVHRYAPGEVDELGAPIGGQKWTELIVCDPEAPAELLPVDRHQSTDTDAPEMKVGASADIPPRARSGMGESPPQPSAEKPRWPSPGLVPAGAAGESPRDQCSKPSADDPSPDHPPLKQDQAQEHSSSSLAFTTIAGREHRATAAPNDDESVAESDPALAERLAALDSRLRLGELLDRLAQHHPEVAIGAIDLSRAADDILGAAPRRVGNPVAYVASSLAAEPWRWVRTEDFDRVGSATAKSASQPERTPRRPPTGAECAAAGHRWIGEFDESCAWCGSERPHWRDDRDAALAVTAPSRSRG
ncbi:hypothetical protein AVP42_02542 [Agromyces sp. NDB4Y10]|uniref:hypothetical protein n=1 Tax=Agromyces sp. NDB4Y10 TaxID=1775951 RepID=UPI0007B29926|nr:hypothetical protein [Agromyces sp. NDB4Y10]KZE92388.1 hypothetical protein AVP42_02542 [Agromyces sp. NDB4Y10]